MIERVSWVELTVEIVSAIQNGGIARLLIT